MLDGRFPRRTAWPVSPHAQIPYLVVPTTETTTEAAAVPPIPTKPPYALNTAVMGWARTPVPALLMAAARRPRRERLLVPSTTRPASFGPAISAVSRSFKAIEIPPPDAPIHVRVAEIAPFALALAFLMPIPPSTLFWLIRLFPVAVLLVRVERPLAKTTSALQPPARTDTRSATAIEVRPLFFVDRFYIGEL